MAVRVSQHVIHQGSETKGGKQASVFASSFYWDIFLAYFYCVILCITECNKNILQGLIGFSNFNLNYTFRIEEFIKH